eukprot:COSAG01_NODE_11151_length_1995_cov_16.477321_3_plen_71_part_00
MVLDWVQGEFQDKRERKMADLARFKTMVTVSPAPQPLAAPPSPPFPSPFSSPFLHFAPPDHARAGEHAGW